MSEVALQSIRPRTLAEAGLSGPAIEQFKSDRRSTVWSVAARLGPARAGAQVIKRFDYSPIRQRLSLLMGNHPGQIELRWNLRLQEKQVPVVPLIDGGIERAGSGLGRRAWLATALSGTSLQRLIRDPAVRRQRGEVLLAAAARLATRLFAAGFWSRDLKPSNIIVDPAGECWLIDVGSVRLGASPANVARTLAVMDRVLARDGVEENLRTRFGEMVRIAQ
jgi:hypothetical protein